jgi:hypothetical protein
MISQKRTALYLFVVKKITGGINLFQKKEM